ncbi:hypothetical protein FIU87_00405 [Bacillus sp. THAF10]|nr:hypothetical protein FIU87_00405 [Bacillus sp. THAF10]
MVNMFLLNVKKVNLSASEFIVKGKARGDPAVRGPLLKNQ